MKKTILLNLIFFFVLGSGFISGQSKSFVKAKECYQEGKFIKALKKIEKVKNDKSQTKNAEMYLLESKILLGVNDVEPDEKVKKDAVKAAIKAKLKADDPQFIKNNQAHYDLIGQINTDEALTYFNNKRYSKAIVLFKRSLELGQDSFAEYMLAKSYVLSKSNRRAFPLLDDLVNKQYANYLNDGNKPGFMADAFNIYTGILYEKEKYDSAEFYLIMGLDMFPTDKEMLTRQKKVWYGKVGQIPLSYTLYDFLDKATQTYPFDSVFTFKKNGVYLMFISNNIKAKDFVASDSWLQRMISEKMNLSSRNPSERQKKQDYFLEKDSAIILEKLLFYFGNFKELEAQNIIFERYTNAKFGKSSEASLKHLEGLFPAQIVSSIYKYEIKQTKSKPLINQRLRWYNQLKASAEKKASDFEALLAMNNEVSNSSNRTIMKNDYRELLMNYWRLSIREQDFWKAYELGVKADAIGVKGRSELWKQTIRADFRVNYYGTRVLLNRPASEPYGFAWNGEVSNCNPGFLPDSILKKISKRINYFRRTAHLSSPVGLMTNYNKACQWAALFYTANNNLTHELNPNLNCYTRGGAKAARLGLLTQGVHTSIAVTEFMNDRNSSVGNRRWLLYPPTQFMGFGCTDDQSVLQCVEDKISWDTSSYISNGVAWPPKGYSSSIFAFKYWSYSSYQNFEGAKVTMVNEETGKQMACTVQEIKNGYGMPSLVWQPAELIRRKNEDASYQVTIALKGGRVIQYTVHLVKTEL